MKKLETIKNKLSDIDIQLDSLYKKQRELETEYNISRESLLLKNDSLLQEDTWKLRVNERTLNLYLEDDNFDGFKKLRKLYETDNHCYSTICNFISLVFHDNELILSAPSNTKLIEFIKEYNLKITSSLGAYVKIIDDKISELQATKSIITDLIDKL